MNSTFTNTISFASKAKGPLALFKRMVKIIRRYGITSRRMELNLSQFSEILRKYDCGATFPITAVAIMRHKEVIAKFLNGNIEFAVHGYVHIDLDQVSQEVRSQHLRKARAIFSEAGINACGFRSPYLSHAAELYDVIRDTGFEYVSNQPILWEVFGDKDVPAAKTSGYKRALDLYMPWKSTERSSLPRMKGQLVDIPVSLPDDEILMDRLESPAALVKETWKQILSQAYQREELFTLQLHPERVAGCADALSAVLLEARSLLPHVWIARLDEITEWWQARSSCKLQVTDRRDGGFDCAVIGPAGITTLIRGVDVDVPTTSWANGYRQVEARSFIIHAETRPFIGVSERTSLLLRDWLLQRGYVVEVSEEKQLYLCYFDEPEFSAEHERLVLETIEELNSPLIRLGLWPDGARCALSITGDIDALTIWDYVLRLFGQ